MESLRGKLHLGRQLNSLNQSFNTFNISSLHETKMRNRRFQRRNEIVLRFEGLGWTKGCLSKMFGLELVRKGYVDGELWSHLCHCRGFKNNYVVLYSYINLDIIYKRR
jgi:hypothetical protein